MLSKRLNVIYYFIDFDAKVVDVGCDHGLLLIELAKNYKCNVLLGVDNKKGPIEIFKNNLKLNNLTSYINVSLSDGLDDVNSNYDTLVIAGMGSDNIINIINKNIDKLVNFETIIIDSHTDTKKIRSFFVNLGYYIENEKIIEDYSIVYEIIKFKKGKAEYSELELKYGPIILKYKNEDFIQIYNKKLEYLNNKLNNCQNDSFKDELIENINEIKGILKL